MNPSHRAAAVACAATLATTAAVADPIFSTGIDMIASVQQSVIPGAILFDGGNTVLDASSSPVETAQLLHLAPDFGVNASGRSTTIRPAFGSALAESDGNGGVGVSDLMFFNPGSGGTRAIGQIAAQASWAQSFTWGGTSTVDLRLHLHVPDLQVGLIDVPPNRSAPSATETARAEGRVTSIITHPDGTFTTGGGILFGIEMHEEQFLLGPGTYENFAASTLVGSTFMVTSWERSGDDFDPIDTVTLADFDVAVGLVQPGDVIRYLYTLTAVGTTAGGEQGYFAFVGDPFAVGAGGVGVVPVITPVAAVPASGSGWLAALGLGAVACGRRRGR